MLILFILTPVFAQAISSGAGLQLDFRTPPWELITVLAVVASFSVIAVAYLISKAFGISELSGWVRDEAYQLIAMTILVFFVFSVIQVEKGIFESFGYVPTAQNSNPAITSASDYLYSVRTYVGTTLSSVYVLNSVVQAGVYKYKMPISKYINPIDISKGYKEFAKAFSDLLMTVNNAFGAVLGLTTAQIMFLDLINRTAFTILLPLGVFLRVFTFSRGVGTFFIAIAIAFYVVYPLTFALNQKIVDHLLGYENAWKDIVKARTYQIPVFGQLVELADSKLQPKEGADSSSIFNFYSNMFGGMVHSVSSGAAYINMALPFTLLREGAFAFVLFTVIPIIDFVITLGVARELGSLLGGDVSFGDLLKSL